MGKQRIDNFPDLGEVLQQVLSEQLSSIDAAPVSAEMPAFKEMYFDHAEPDNSRWKELVRAALENAQHFEIHCWNEEQECIALARKFGREKETNWRHGVVIAGSVTREFKEWILQLPKPADTDIYNKMTPFFNLFLDDIFQSCHYGTEVYY